MPAPLPPLIATLLLTQVSGVVPLHPLDSADILLITLVSVAVACQVLAIGYIIYIGIKYIWLDHD